ncbi:hypothetical protein SAMN02745751_01267 [Dethiosulfatibacter aminovorans DSM 17477]|uniref:Uncharacterized protein n=1 Tax=Dethiosulfatibacter aminovorans DSM 17477 TaxID=1121476 RepID=A0A1M6EP88_9FIRM|nr:hypothetical protein [Dethiosulfatibacter aminovorans]SHI87199.1 hypothetical protein SAMN02745751_01267 [Dethiosulfatibacter aminovorans DSM 17477]
MARPSKSIELVEGHRTKAEIEKRQQAEKALLTNVEMKEWPTTKADPVAHNHFLRISELFKAIEKNDALSEPTFNRYCLMLSECEGYEVRDKKLKVIIDDLERRWQGEMEYAEYIKMVINLNKQIQTNDRLLMSKRRLLLSIEKESLMTLASQLRSIPKKEDEDYKLDPMYQLLNT